MASTLPQPHPVIGREAELGAIGGFLDLVETGPAALTLEGEAGIGKSTLMDEGLTAAAARSYRVASCRPIRAEAQLAYTSLGDLLADVEEEELAALPGPQRRALEVALLRAEPDDEQLFPRAVALGLLGVLAGRARARPTVVGIDDVQWLDQPTARTLAFVARRLVHQPIGLLLTRRLDTGVPSPLDLDGDRLLPEDRFSTVQVAALGVEELDRLLRSRLGRRVPRPLLARLHRASGGNALFALELARAVVEQGDRRVGLTDDLPIPVSLQRLVGDRLARLPGVALETAQVASALSRPTVALIQAMLGDDDAAAGVEAARQAGILDVDRDRVVFAHPVHASVAYVQLSPADKRRLHGRLARVVDDPEERGRHLAIATPEPDARVASSLDDAARRARARGAPDAAAELWEQARRVSPPDDPAGARRRGIEAAERWFEAGDAARARGLLREMLAGAPQGGERALVLARLGWVTAHTEGFHAGEAVFREALAEPATDPAVRIEVEQGLAWCVHSTTGVREAIGHASAAVELAEALGEPALLASALSQAGFLESLAGNGLAIEATERAVALGHVPAWSQILGRPDWIHPLLLQWGDDLGGARRQFEVLHRDAVDRGDEHSLPFILFHLARVELLGGDWVRARRHARECHETARRSGQASERPYAHAIEALVEAHFGLVEAARAKIDEGLSLARQTGGEPAALEMLAARGFLELSLGDAGRAERTLDEVAAATERTGLRDPALFRFHGDAVEAKVALGRRDEAGTLLDELDRRAAALDRAWVRMVARRGRGLLSAALGDVDAARRALEDALGREDVGQPFERARTLLVLGTVQRRAKQKRAARDALGGALATFEQLGAELWAARTRAELARIGGRAPASGLTPTEERVATLIAAGRTYREAADELFISPKTVQWNLSKVYRKLGIRSRAELPTRLAARTTAED
jgi:DNA-binding CsgD family transcriptional regulator